MVGSLTGAVSSQSVTEELEGTLGTVGNRADSAMAQACLTARLTSRAGAKAGHSDPVVLYGRAIAQRIKGTPGITGLFLPRVHIDGGAWHLDVGSSHPGAVAGPKGSAVRRIKWYGRWVQNVDNTALTRSKSWKKSTGSYRWSPPEVSKLASEGNTEGRLVTMSLQPLR